MAEASWYYAQSGKRIGPVSRLEIDALAQTGVLKRADLVWTAGMAQWAAAGSTELFKTAPVAAPVDPPVAVAPDPQPQVAQPMVAFPASSHPVAYPAAYQHVAYYSPGGGMPTRATAALQGHSRPRGDTGTWPLDDVLVSQFDQTLKLRRRVTGAAQLYRLFLFLGVISVAAMGVVALVSLAMGGRAARTVDTVFVVQLVQSAAWTALYYFTWRGTMRCQRWAPMTMLVLYALGGVACLIGLAVLGATGPDISAVIVGIIAVILIFGAMIFVSWRSFAAIPKYLAQPAWCQELLVRAKL